MADSFHSLTYHLIRSTKNREPWLSAEIRPRLWKYLGGIAHSKRMVPLCIGGYTDHVHGLVRLPPDLSVSKAVQLLKGPSSKWIHGTFPGLKAFAWQDGYAAFTVSQSQRAHVREYIRDQEAHHRVKTFKEEFAEFLRRHEIDADPRYTWG